jgi:hypothetical protein
VIATSFQVGSGALAALIAILLTVIILAVIVGRMMKRDPLIRIARIGVFVQRERLVEPGETWSADPLDEEGEPRPAPLPPPTPPPPLPPRRDDAADDTEAWPQREERP